MIAGLGGVVNTNLYSTLWDFSFDSHLFYKFNYLFRYYAAFAFLFKTPTWLDLDDGKSELIMSYKLDGPSVDSNKSQII